MHDTHDLTILERRVRDLDDSFCKMQKQLDRMEALLKQIAQKQHEAAVIAVVRERP